MHARLALPALALVALCCDSTLAAEKRRKYEAGPLTAADFAGAVPADAKASARTATELRYEHRYKYKSSSLATTATLDSLEINSYIRLDLSWNRTPRDVRLMDHEQGHADISRIHCLQARIAMREKMRAGFSATASSLKEAIAALERDLNQEMSVFEQAVQEADAEYDRQTSHGLGAKHAEWRRVQQETLKDLEAKWKPK